MEHLILSPKTIKKHCLLPKGKPYEELGFVQRLMVRLRLARVTDADIEKAVARIAA